VIDVTGWWRADFLPSQHGTLMLENGADIRMIQAPEPASAYDSTTMNLDRITTNPKVMGGKPCIRGMRVTAGTVVGLVATEHTREEILELYPYLEEEDIRQALSYAAWRAERLPDTCAGPVSPASW